jgi:hypothetical protein
MKRAFLASLAIAAIGLATQCFAAGGVYADGDCPNCKPGLFHRGGGFFPFKKCTGCGKLCGPLHKCGGLLHHHQRMSDDMMGYGGPVAAQVTYPYYTIRGPRDFLDPNPRGIGP